MTEKIRKIIEEVKNPLTGKNLGEERRIVECFDKNDRFDVVYTRDGIDPLNKRKIEEEILLKLEGTLKYSRDQIFIKTVSQDSKDIYKEEKSAALKTGHAPSQGSGPIPKKIPNIQKIVAVSSCKGGVGKSTVSVNLALALKIQGKKVGLLDGDIYGPSVPILLGQRNIHPKAASKEGKKIEPINIHELKFISFGSFIPESDPVIWRGPMLGGVLNQFLFDVDWGELDYLVIDLPPGTGDIQLSLIQNVKIDGTVVVSTPQQVALLDTKKGLNMFKRMNIPVLGMIENMSYFVPEDDQNKKYFIFGKGGVEKVAHELDVPFLGGIPLATSIRETSDLGNPYMNHKEFDKDFVWKSYMEISQKLDKIFNNGPTKKFWNKLFS